MSFREAFRRRRDLVVERVDALPMLSLAQPDGAFYAFIDCSACIGRVTADGVALVNDDEVASYLLREALIAVVPGSAFGHSPFFRIPTATSEENLHRAFDRVTDALAALR